MNEKMKTILISVCLGLFFCAPAFGMPKPLLLLTHAQGDVHSSRDGKTWKKVRRNKFLFEGAHVKTGTSGTCKLLDQKASISRDVGSGSYVIIRLDNIEVKNGDVSEPQNVSGVIDDIMRKFAKVQRYTAVTRSAERKGKIKLETAEIITLSDDYPEMVWENAGSEYDYRLFIGENVYEVPGSDHDIIRFKPAGIKPGQYHYGIKLIQKGKVIFSPDKERTLTWLSHDQAQKIDAAVKRIEQFDPGNGFLIGNYLDEKGIKAASMDQYHSFFTAYPDENELRPFLIKIYHDLRLEKLRERETTIFKQQMDD